MMSARSIVGLSSPCRISTDRQVGRLSYCLKCYETRCKPDNPWESGWPRKRIYPRKSILKNYGFACLLILTALVGCSQKDSAPFQQLRIEVSPNTPQDLADMLNSAWPKVLASCPGLSKFASDMKFEGIENNLAYAPAEAKRIDVLFRVAESAKIPAEYAVSGNRCFFSLTPDGKKLAISKSGCASLCADKRIDAKGNYELSL